MCTCSRSPSPTSLIPLHSPSSWSCCSDPPHLKSPLCFVKTARPFPPPLSFSSVSLSPFPSFLPQLPLPQQQTRGPSAADVGHSCAPSPATESTHILARDRAPAYSCPGELKQPWLRLGLGFGTKYGLHAVHQETCHPSSQDCKARVRQGPAASHECNHGLL